MKKLAIAVSSLVLLGVFAAIATVVSSDAPADRQQQLPRGDWHTQLSQAELRDRFLEIPKRLTRELFADSSSRIVGFQLSDSRSDRPAAARPDGPVDTVTVKPLEDIGCGCCTFDVECESFGDEEFRLISLLKDLKHVAVSSTHVTDDGPLLLRSQSQLESLDVSNNPLLTDAVVDRLVHLKSLRRLDLSDTALTGKGLSKLAALPRLERLVLAGTQLSDPMVRELSELQQLKELDLGRTQITGAGFARLRSLRDRTSRGRARSRSDRRLWERST